MKLLILIGWTVLVIGLLLGFVIFLQWVADKIFGE